MASLEEHGRIMLNIMRAREAVRKGFESEEWSKALSEVDAILAKTLEICSYPVDDHSVLSRALAKFGARIPRPQLLPEPNLRMTTQEWVKELNVSPYYINDRCGGFLRLSEAEDYPTWNARYYILHDKILLAVWKAGSLSECTEEDTWLPLKSGESGYRFRFYRIGCLHRKRTLKRLRQFEWREECLDCGFAQTFDSSG